MHEAGVWVSPKRPIYSTTTLYDSYNDCYNITVPTHIPILLWDMQLAILHHTCMGQMHASIVDHYDVRTATIHFLEILQFRLLHQKIGYTKQ